MRFEILDHGYIELVEAWGSDERIIEAARMSTGKGFLGWGPKHYDSCRFMHGTGEAFGHCDCPHDIPGDEKLLRYLYTNNHASPFEMGGLIIEVQAPIFVFREWHRHRTQSYNEMSARYAPLPDLNYVPSVERIMMGGGHLTKQAAGTGAELLEVDAELYQASLIASYQESQRLYDVALSAGIPKELARVHLPVGRYSRMRASANLRNWLAFLTLRQAPNAQWEIRQYADAVGELVKEAFPHTWGLFTENK